MHAAKRPQMRRYAMIDRELRAGRYPTAQELARVAEVNVRTIRRDLEFMRDSLHAPLEFHRQRRGWYYATASYHLPTTQLGEPDVAALAIAASALSAAPGTPFGQLARDALSGIASQLAEGGPATYATALETHPFHNSAPLAGSLEILAELSQACHHRQPLRILYWTAGRDETAWRDIDPWRLGCVDGQWYLFAYCHLRQSVRMFATWRIDGVERLVGSYHIPEDFSIPEFLSHGFQRISGPSVPRERVRLWFSSYAARYIRERQWHPTQQLTDLPGGELELALEVSALDELERWIMSWSEHVEVLAPHTLRTRIHNLAANLADRHETPQQTFSENRTSDVKSQSESKPLKAKRQKHA
jgi:predicted DNA-binding transcriptional regulator YafY